MSDVRFANPKRTYEITGIGVTRIYELLGSGELRALKVGRRTLVDVQHALEWIQKHPPARINYGKKQQASSEQQAA